MFFRFICLVFLTTSVFASSHTFEDFLDQIRQMATEQGVSKTTIDKAFFQLSPRPEALEKDIDQPEFNQNFWSYVNKRVTQTRLNNGYDTLKQNSSLLNKTTQQYGVPAYILVSFLGIESNYGYHTGNHNLIQSLATLAYDQRRSKFFTRELIALLKLIDKNTIPLDAKGSWAGAIGAVQFMPTSVQAYGVDANKDGKIDLWNDKEDIYASAGNFLKKNGWTKGEKWGREASIPKNFDYKKTGLGIKKSVNDWAKLGILRANGNRLPNSNMKASLIVPMGHRGPAFLVYRNFDVIMDWNHSILYAISVGYLANRINGSGKLIAKPIDELLLSKDNVLTIQQTLNLLGYNTGVPDGMAGPKTRSATREFQSDIGLVADGYVGYELYQQLQ
jgi:membrane-bound lytic murein transglycosylase B